MPVYGAFSDPPPGGNFVQADGNPSFESTFDQKISGLTIGQSYLSELLGSRWAAGGIFRRDDRAMDRLVGHAALTSPLPAAEAVGQGRIPIPMRARPSWLQR